VPVAVPKPKIALGDVHPEAKESFPPADITDVVQPAFIIEAGIGRLWLNRFCGNRWHAKQGLLTKSAAGQAINAVAMRPAMFSLR
jgi:hypothetical protein